MGNLPLDPEPWHCVNWFVGTDMRHNRCHEGGVFFEPREGYEQDENAYPDEFFEED